MWAVSGLLVTVVGCVLVFPSLRGDSLCWGDTVHVLEELELTVHPIGLGLGLGLVPAVHSIRSVFLVHFALDRVISATFRATEKEFWIRGSALQGSSLLPVFLSSK